jgi:MoaD family protein
MNIEVLFFGKFREITGVSQAGAVIDDGSCLDSLVEHLAGKYGQEFREMVDGIPGLRILVEGREYYLLGRLNAPLKDGNTVVFLPPITGG